MAGRVIDVVRLRNPNALNLPPISDLFRAAFCANPRVPVDYNTALPDFRNMVSEDRFGVFLGFENGPKALGVVELPHSRIFPFPTVLTMYSSGTRELTKTLISSGVDFIRSHGYTKAWAVNASQHTDPVWLRAFGSTPGTPIGSLVEFDLADPRPSLEHPV